MRILLPSLNLVANNSNTHSNTQLPLAANMFSVLLHGPSGSGKSTILRAAANVLGFHITIWDCYDLVGTSGGTGELKHVLSEARDHAPCMLVLKNIAALEHSAYEKKDAHTITNFLNDELEKFSNKRNGASYPLLIGTASRVDYVSVGLRGWFRHEIELQAPEALERAEILEFISADNTLSPSISISDLARRTASFYPTDLSCLMSQASLAASRRIMKAMR